MHRDGLGPNSAPIAAGAIVQLERAESSGKCGFNRRGFPRRTEFLEGTPVMGKKSDNFGFGPEVPPELQKAIDEVAAKVVSEMSPLEMGLLRYPFAEPVKLERVPKEVIKDHLTRYTKAELKRGQFFRVGDKYTFFMDHKAKAKREWQS